MTSADHNRVARWHARTIEPPGNLAALRRAVAAQPCGALLESLGQGDSAGRYSIFAHDPVRLIQVGGAGAADPFAQLSEACRPWCRLVPEPELPFVGGWIGFLSYEAGRFVEPSAGWSHRLAGVPLSHWALYDTVLIHDRLADVWSVAGVTLPAKLAGRTRPPIAARLDALEKWTAHPVPAGPCAGEQDDAAEAEWAANASPIAAARPPREEGRWNIPRREYLRKVERALEYIRAGDVFQVNLARQCHCRVTGHPIDLYQRLSETNPAAYAAYLSGGDPIRTRRRTPGQRHWPAWSIVSSSPELFLRLRGRQVTTKPIKGTRPRGASPAQDAAAQRALTASAKDRAELNMIIDLERNDLGRVCEFGTVRVLDDGRIEALPTVFHRTATVTGRLRDDADAIDLLRATFPGGSVTGAPKVRAMQIINELEPEARGPYCGAVGIVGIDGDMELNLAIRTMRVRSVARGGGMPQSVASLCVGSGIVADSQGEAEYAELQAKAAGMMRALDAARAPAPCRQDVPAAALVGSSVTVAQASGL
jgi:para-aminobenzoate synthetase component 1